MKKYHLYVKKHSKTGLKYLGFTSQDPFGYRGSGCYWKSHISKYGPEYIKTIIINSFDNKKDLREAGLFYSRLWDVVESEQWANLVEEAGEGNPPGFVMKEEQRKKISQTRKELFKTPRGQELRQMIMGDNNPSKRTDVREKNRQAQLGTKQSPEHIEKRVSKVRGKKRPDLSERNRQRTISRPKSLSFSFGQFPF